MSNTTRAAAPLALAHSTGALHFLQDKGYDDDVIETKVAEVRKKLENEELKLKDDGPRRITETHALADAKSRDAAKMANAFGIRADRQEGESFDRELQEQRKQQKREEYERKQIEREAHERRMEKERKASEKRRKKEEEESDRTRQRKDRSPARKEGKERSRSPVRRDRSPARKDRSPRHSPPRSPGECVCVCVCVCALNI